MQNQSKAYIYGLVHPDDELILSNVCYVGKTNNIKYRMQGHLSCARKPRSSVELYRWIGSFLSEEKLPQILIIEECEKNIWSEREKFWIKKLKENKLFNISLGGNGSLGGVKLSPETCERIRIAKLGNKSRLGTKHFEETKQKIANTLFGHPVSDDTRKKMSAASKGHRRNLGRKHTQEEHRKMSESAKNMNEKARYNIWYGRWGKKKMAV